MIKIFFSLLLLFCLMGYVIAGTIGQPPVLQGEPVAEHQYLKTIYDNFNVLDIVTTAPNGNVIGKRGKMILYNNSGTFELYVNTDGSKTWQII